MIYFALAGKCVKYRVECDRWMRKSVFWPSCLFIHDWKTTTVLSNLCNAAISFQCSTIVWEDHSHLFTNLGLSSILFWKLRGLCAPKNKMTSVLFALSQVKVYNFSNQLEKLEAAKAAWLVCLSLLSLTRPYWALLDCTGPYWALLLPNCYLTTT